MSFLMLNVGIARLNGNWNWKNVSSPFTRIYYVTEGEATLYLPQRSVRLRPGYLYMVPAYTLHSYGCDGLFTHYYLHVYEGVKKEMDVMELYDFPSEVKAQEGDEQLFERMCRQYPETRLPSDDPTFYDNAATFTDFVQRYSDMALWEKMALRGAMLTLFSRFMREATPRFWRQDERLSRVMNYIHCHIDADVDVKALADVACLSSPYLIRLFKREVGLSPMQYVNRKKAERAQLLLCTTDSPVKEIAFATGFSDQSYFIRLFRKICGVTPQEYRLRMRASRQTAGPSSFIP